MSLAVLPPRLSHFPFIHDSNSCSQFGSGALSGLPSLPLRFTLVAGVTRLVGLGLGFDPKGSGCGSGPLFGEILLNSSDEFVPGIGAFQLVQCFFVRLFAELRRDCRFHFRSKFWCQ